MKKTFLYLCLLAFSFPIYAQSLKSNGVEISFSIPKKFDITGLKTYQTNFNSNVMSLTTIEKDEVPGSNEDRPANIKAADEEKKKRMAYATITIRGMKSVNQNGDIVIDITTTDFTFSERKESLASAAPEDVVAIINGSMNVTVTKKSGEKLIERNIPIPAEDAVITKSKLLALSPGLSIQIKLVKKSNTQEIDRLLNGGLEATNAYYLQNLLTQAGHIVRAAFEDQKGTFSLPLYYSKGKQDYTELTAASETFKTMASSLAKSQKIADLKSNNTGDVIRKSIATWEQELSLVSTTEDARINEDIARGLNLNLATAYILLGEWPKASVALSRSGFVIADGTELGGTGTTKEYYMDIRNMLYMASPAEEQIVFNY